MHFGWGTRLALVVVVATTGCHHLSYEPDDMRVDGYRYSVGSAVVGPALDTLRVAVVVVNDSRQQRALSFPHCPPVLNPIKAILRTADKEWNSDALEMRKQSQYFDSSGKPIPQVCLAYLAVMMFPPGGSYTYVLTVPVEEILGDSLPSGRYHVTAQLRLNGHVTRKLIAADVELARPAK
jgi:hypothetical protein